MTERYGVKTVYRHVISKYSGECQEEATGNKMDSKA